MYVFPSLGYYPASPFPFAQGAQAGPYQRFPGATLGEWRPSQAVYGAPRSLRGPRRMGQDDGSLNVAVNPTLLIGGGIALAAALLLWSGKKARRGLHGACKCCLRRKLARLEAAG